MMKWCNKKMIAVVAGVLGISLSVAAYVQAAEPLRNVSLEEGVTKIEKYQYFSQGALEQVSLPSTLQEIGFSAFDNCTSLGQINLPEGLKIIDNRGFAKCKSLKEITIPDTVSKLGNAAFYGCTSLKSIVLPESITRVENNLFYQCSALENVTISDKVTEIGQQSFYDCSALTQIKLPAGLKKIEDGAFYNCSGLTTLEIPDTVTYIGKDAFYGCSNLVISCSSSSYAANYALSAGVRVYTGEEQNLNVEVVEAAVTATEGEMAQTAEQVPETGIELPYLLCLLMLFGAGGFLLYLKKTDGREKTLRV